MPYTRNTDRNDILNVLKALEYIIANTKDPSTLAGLWIDFPHHQIHEGDSYVASYAPDTVKGDGAGINITLKTPDNTKWLHMQAKASAALGAFFTITRGPTFTGGTAQAGFNRNQNSTNPTGASDVKFDCTPSGGTVVHTELMGSGKKGGSGSRGTEEFMLKQNTVYVFTVTSDVASNKLGLDLSWYEHTAL